MVVLLSSSKILTLSVVAPLDGADLCFRRAAAVFVWVHKLQMSKIGSGTNERSDL